MKERFRRAPVTARAARSLPAREGLIVALAGALIVWYRLRLALPGPWGGHRLLGRRLESGEGSSAAGRNVSRPRAARLGELFRRAAAQALVSAPCGPRSLALARLLRLHGLGAEVRIGLRRAGGALAGHTWVEHDGVPVGDDATFVRAFTPLRLVRRPHRGGRGMDEHRDGAWGAPRS
jgi:hypothetical protein